MENIKAEFQGETDSTKVSTNTMVHCLASHISDRTDLDQVDRNIDVAASGVGTQAHAALAFHLSATCAEGAWAVAAYTLSSDLRMIARW